MKLKTTKLGTCLMLLLLGASACKKNPIEVRQEPERDFKGMKVPNDFSYNNNEVLPLSAEVLLLGNTPYDGAKFEIYLDDLSTAIDADQFPDSLRMIGQFKLDAKGKYLSEVKVPTNTKKLYLLSKSIGIPQYFELEKTSAGFQMKYDAETAYGKSKPVNAVSFSRMASVAAFAAVPRSWDNVGFPDYLSAPIYVSSRFLRRFQAAVPYKTPVNPDYLKTDIPRSIVLDLKPGQTADVKITFMFANSANKNTLGYYWFNTNTPPANAAAITNKNYIFPSTSRQNTTNYSGLVAGNTVTLVGPNADGSFPPNTTIGFFLISNGFTPTAAGSPGQINTNRTTYYSNQNFNAPGTSANMLNVKERMVSLYDEATNRIVWAIEDGVDGDYSDVAFFATWNPNEAVPKDKYPPLPEVPQTDADFVYYPAKDLKGTLLFEDCWPRLADFDMNDMVINHNYTGLLDENGKISQLNVKFDLTSVSAQQNNGFALLIPNVPSANIQSISNLNMNGSNTNSNLQQSYAVETGNSRDAVIRVFDNASAILGGNEVNNVGAGNITAPAKTFSFTVNMKPAMTVADFHNISPFVTGRGVRSVEIHLANRRPSFLVNTSLFKTEDDNSSASTGVYYLSNTRNSLGNLCWAVDVPMKIPYPKSGKAIIAAYKNFEEWATSGGKQKTDWYTSGTGNRVAGLLVYP